MKLENQLHCTGTECRLDCTKYYIYYYQMDQEKVRIHYISKMEGLVPFLNCLSLTFAEQLT